MEVIKYKDNIIFNNNEGNYAHGVSFSLKDIRVKDIIKLLVMKIKDNLYSGFNKHESRK